MLGRLIASGRERTRREMFTICRSLLPVGEEILRGRDLHTVSQKFGCCDRNTPAKSYIHNTRSSVIVTTDIKITTSATEKPWTIKVEATYFCSVAASDRLKYLNLFHLAAQMEQSTPVHTYSPCFNRKCSCLRVIRYVEWDHTRRMFAYLISYIIGYWNHGILKWSPSANTSFCIPPTRLNIIARCPPSTVNDIWVSISYTQLSH